MSRLAGVYGPWPGADQRSLLRAALLDGDAARQAWAEWTSRVDLDAIDAGSFRLLPLLYRNLTQLGIQPPELGRIRGVVRQTWYKNRLVAGWLADVLGACRVAGVPTLVLKGVPLALRYYGDLSLRPMADADLLVPTARAADVLPILQSGGWRPLVEPLVWPPTLTASTAFVNDLGVELDVHDHLLPECVAPGDDDDFWAAAEPIDVGAERTLALCAADQLLHAIVHGYRRSTVPPIRWVVDATMVIRGAGQGVSWDRLVEQSKQRKLSSIVASGLRYVRETLDVDVPSAVLRSLESAPASLGERLERWSRTRPGTIRLAVEGWADYTRASRRLAEWRGPLGPARYFRDRLRVSSIWRVPGAAVSTLASSASEAASVASRPR